MKKGKKSKGSGSGGRRPHRQRTQVQHYSDDNPSTFTKKRRRADGDSTDDSDSDSDESMEMEQQQPISSKSNAAAATTAANKKTEFQSHNNSAAEKKKRKRSPSPHNSNIINKNNNNTNPPKMQEAPPPSPPKNTMMPHTASLAPILPLATTCPLARFSLAQQYPVVFGRGLGVPTPPRAPEWKNLNQYDFYFPGDYKTATVAAEDMTERGSTTKIIPIVPSGIWPVCRVVTTVATYQHFTAMGDSAGFVMLYTSGALSGMNPLARLETMASEREHKRQRQEQRKLEQQFKHKPDLLNRRSPFWATAKTPNAILDLSWVGTLLIVLTPQEVEAIQLNSDTTTSTKSSVCDRLWSIPVLAPPRKITGSVLLSGGGLSGTYLELHPQPENDMVLWNTWDMALAANKKKAGDDKADEQTLDTTKSGGDETTKEQRSNSPYTGGNDEEWPLLILHNARRSSSSTTSPEFVKIIPFQRHEEEEAPPTPVKRSPGRPPKKKPKPKIPVTKQELLWTDDSKCHAVTWDNRNAAASSSHYYSRHYDEKERFLMVYSATSVMAASEAQVQLSLMELTDDSSAEDDDATTTAVTTTTTTKPPQYARLKKQVAIPVTGSVKNFPEVTLRQSPKGTYTLVSGSRGVRMYETDTLACLRVYGEHVSLHGKAMVWQSCFVVDNHLQQELYQQQQEQEAPKKEIKGRSNNNDEDEDSSSQTAAALGKTVLRQSRQGAEEFVWMEQDNAIASLLSKEEASAVLPGSTRRRNSLKRLRASSFVEEDDDESEWLHQAWIVGVPHAYRGPKELQETIYFWQGPEKLPLFTLPLPHESGGVQSIHPVVASSNRKDGVWLRLMVVTVNGECLELSPTVQTDFPGIMYNPGYDVIQDNLEYIEDEDELDKVIVEVQEEEEESDEDEPEAPLVGAEVIEDIVDPELAEAIRLSLLEAQANQVGGAKPAKEKSAADDEDENDSDIVVVTDDYGDTEQHEVENQLLIPCRPEPFLQQRLLPDIEADTILNDDDGTGSNKSAKDAEFASEVLSILPQAKSAQDKWEQRKLRPAPKTVFSKDTLQQEPEQPKPTSANGVSMGPPTGKAMKGKRSRTGNLEALLKSSIDPELRQYMSERDRYWADGHGSTLQQDAWNHAKLEDEPATATQPEKPEAPAAPAAVGSTSGASQEQNSKSSEEKPENGNLKKDVITTAPGLSIDPPNNDSRSQEEENAKKEVAMELLLLSPGGTPKAESGSQPAGASSEMTDAVAKTGTGAQTKPADCAMPSVVTEESKPSSPQDSAARGISFDGMQIAIIELKDYTDSAQQYSCTGSVEVPLSLEDCRVASSGGALPDKQKQNESDKNGDLSSRDKSLKSGEKGSDENSARENGKRSTKEHEGLDIRCAACQGRMVIHTCGKRALPIDFEALARAEKERQEKVEEEKRKLRREKQRQAEVKRKEAKRKKKEKEERERREKEEELRKIREAELAEARARMSEAGAHLATELVAHHGLETPAAAAEINGHVQPKHDPVHFAIADAWQEHASKFSSTNEDTTTTTTTTTKWPAAETGNRDAEDSSRSDALAALANMAGMAQAATPQNENVAQQPQSEEHQVSYSASKTGLPEADNPRHLDQDRTVDEKKAAHGFFSSADAYPSGAMPANLETRGTFSAAAQEARRTQIMNSYQAMAAENPSASKARVVDMPNQSTPSHQMTAHSFQISPSSSNRYHGFGTGSSDGHGFHQNQQTHHLSSGVNLSASSSAANDHHAPRPYFGYTQISNNFKPKVPLRSYDSCTIYTSKPAATTISQQEPQQEPPSSQQSLGGSAEQQQHPPRHGFFHSMPPRAAPLAAPPAVANVAAPSATTGIAGNRATTLSHHTHHAPAPHSSLNTTWLPQPTNHHVPAGGTRPHIGNIMASTASGVVGNQNTNKSVIGTAALPTAATQNNSNSSSNNKPANNFQNP